MVRGGVWFALHLAGKLWRLGPLGYCSSTRGNHTEGVPWKRLFHFHGYKQPLYYVEYICTVNFLNRRTRFVCVIQLAAVRYCVVLRTARFFTKRHHVALCMEVEIDIGSSDSNQGPLKRRHRTWCRRTGATLSYGLRTRRAPDSLELLLHAARSSYAARWAEDRCLLTS